MSDPLATDSPELDVSPPETRKRGRPRLNGAKPADDAQAIPLDAVAKQGRGRPRKAPTQDTIGALAGQVKGLHIVAAMALGIPELTLSDPESVMLAGAIMAVCKEYGLELSGKTGAAMQLMGACAVIYVPRLLAVKQRVIAQQHAAAEFVDSVIPADTVVAH